MGRVLVVLSTDTDFDGRVEGDVYIRPSTLFFVSQPFLGTSVMADGLALYNAQWRIWV